jgi:N-hydroxyarylamine O-acetyltransferase
MKADNFILSEYFARIGFDKEANSELETLKAVMSAQLCSVPFENTEVQAGRIPSLKPEDIVQKIVYDKRGGYCYELNGLFAMALKSLGFEYYFAAARPMTYAERRPKTHMVVIVTLGNEKYLCDCGFGGYGLRAPIRLANGFEMLQDGERFFVEFANGEYLLSSQIFESKSPQYAFADTPQEWIEFGLANYFNATHPNTIFTQKKLAIIQTQNGRKILVDETLKIIENGVAQESSLPYEEAFEKHFRR